MCATKNIYLGHRPLFPCAIADNIISYKEPYL